MLHPAAACPRFVGPFVWFYRGLAGLAMKPGTTGWRALRIAPQAYNFWSSAAETGAGAGAGIVPEQHRGRGGRLRHGRQTHTAAVLLVLLTRA